MTGYSMDLAWLRTEDMLAVRYRHRRASVPADVAQYLIEAFPQGLADPERDFLVAEDALRRDADRMRRQGQTLSGSIAAETRRLGELNRLPSSRRRQPGRHEPRTPPQESAALRTLLAEAQQISDELEHVTELIRNLRALVLDLDVEDGFLGEACRGWNRNPLRPAWITVYDSEAAFLDGDARRAITAQWGGRVPAGEDYGGGWRRDDDEPDPDPGADPLDVTGPWQVAHVPATGEVYALRRCTYRPEELWVLGAGFPTAEQVRSLLDPLQHHRREPNSLMLVTDAVHRATRAAGAADEGGGVA